MLASSTNGTQEDLNEVEQLVRDAQISGETQSIARVLRDVISATVGDGTCERLRCAVRTLAERST